MSADLNTSHLSALSYGIVAAEHGEANARMNQAVAFCRGHDDVAEFYDGPNGIARHVAARRTLEELAYIATRTMVPAGEVEA